MNQQIVDYLKTNKDGYTKESLVEQLKSAGHNENDIQEAVGLVYGGVDVPMSSPVNATEQQPEKQGMSTGKKVALIVGIIFAVGFVSVLVIGSIVMVSLNSARDKAKEASAKSSISSTVPAAILCMDEGSDIADSVVGTSICRTAERVWPVLELPARWSGVVDGDVSDGDFEYKATYGDSGTAHCTETGCVFSD